MHRLHTGVNNPLGVTMLIPAVFIQGCKHHSLIILATFPTDLENRGVFLVIRGRTEEGFLCIDSPCRNTIDRNGLKVLEVSRTAI